MKKTVGLPPGQPETQNNSVLTGEFHVYLPIVTHPPEPPTWINTQVREASRLFYLEAYLGSNTSKANWSGDHASCDPGETSDAFKAAVLMGINYYRSMTGVPASLGFDETYNAKAQAAALMMGVNVMLSHDPDESWICYSPEGEEGAGSSNLSLGRFGLAAITGQFYDAGTTNTSVGHRRWILYPQTRYMGKGDIPYVDEHIPANALWVFDQHLWNRDRKRGKHMLLGLHQATYRTKWYIHAGHFPMMMRITTRQL